MIDIQISSSHGTKPLYLTRGYRDEGLILGYNTRFGGRSAWVRVMP